MDDGSFDLEGVDDAFPLNASQLGMLYHTEAEPGTGVYVGVLDCLLPDDLDLALFKQAWNHVIARHEALRSVFVWRGVDDPLQVVVSECEPTWEEINAPLPEQDGALTRDYVETLRSEGIDLANAPTMRFILGQLPSGARCFIWVCHHALIDDWSQAMVLFEVQSAYRNLVAGEAIVEETAIAFSDFADWLSARNEADDEAFWTQTFAEFATPTRLQLETPLNSDAQPLRGLSERWLDEETSEALRKAATKQRLTLAALATGVWAVVLHRLSGENDVAFGLAATQRPPELGGIDRAIGNFVTTMPARIDVNAYETLGGLIAHSHSFVQDAQPRSGIALSRLQEIIGQPQDAPLFDTILSIKQDAMAGLDDAADALFRTPSIQFKSNFPFAMVVMPGKRIGLRVIYNPKLFTQNAADTALDIFQAALAAAPTSMDQAPSDLPMLSPAADAKAKTGMRNDAVLPDFTPIHAQIKNAAKTSGNATAIATTDTTTTYDELIGKAERLARVLIEEGFGRGDRIGIYLNRSSDVPIAMLGCLMAGVAYVPFDAAFPEARLTQMIKTARLSAIVTRPALAPDFAASAPRTIDLDSAPKSENLTLPQVDAKDPAYVMFTSGSTGTPKGVVITHSNLAASTAARSLWYTENPDVFLLLSSHAFDSSVGGIYWSLSTGGTLCIPSHDEARDIKTVANMIAQFSVSHTLCLPSVYQLVLEHTEQLTTLQTVIVAGEETTSELVAAHQSKMKNTRLVNEYGPTEGTVWCTAADLSALPPTNHVPIGGPIPGAVLYVRDKQGRAVPNGVPGELIVGGAGIADGYFELPDETAKRFHQNTYNTGDLVRQGADGQLIYLGRADEQVKLRGYRIELSEIEAALSARQDIREAAVNVHGAGPAAKLIGYIVVNDDAPLNQDALKAYCANLLPDYMVPTQFMLIDGLPRIPNGKIDRKALPVPSIAPRSDNIVEPSTPMESVLAELWRTVLWQERKIGVTEDFFDLGGHSLIAMRLVNEIEQTFDLRVPLASLGRITTVADQAALLERIRREGDNPAPKTEPSDGLVPSVLKGLSEEEERTLRTLTASWQAPAAREGFNTRVLNENGTLPPLFFCFLNEYSFIHLAKHLGEDQPVYGIRAANSVVPMAGEDQFEENMRRAAISYLPEVLELAGDRPINLGGYCQGSTIALNIASHLTILQRPVATVIVVEKTPPMSYHGHVDVIFTRDGFLNPLREFDSPETVWSRRYGSHSFQMVSGDYGTVFRQPHIIDLSATIREKLTDARKRHGVSLPRAARAVTWHGADIPSTLAPKQMFEIEVTFQNTSNLTWHPTAHSGLRLRAEWRPLEGSEIKLAPSYGDMPRIDAGTKATVPVQLNAPSAEGSYTLEFDIVEEGMARFSKMGNAMLSLATTVNGVASQPVALPQSAHQEAAAPQTQSLRELAQKHLSQNDLETAERHFTAALLMDPNDGDSLIELAKLRILRNRPIRAFFLLRKAKTMGPLAQAEATALLKYYYEPPGIARAIKRKITGKADGET